MSEETVKKEMELIIYAIPSDKVDEDIVVPENMDEIITKHNGGEYVPLSEEQYKDNIELFAFLGESDIVEATEKYSKLKLKDEYKTKPEPEINPIEMILGALMGKELNQNESANALGKLSELITDNIYGNLVVYLDGEEPKVYTYKNFIKDHDEFVILNTYDGYIHEIMELTQMQKIEVNPEDVVDVENVEEVKEEE